jgi:hypothetical protein
MTAAMLSNDARAALANLIVRLTPQLVYGLGSRGTSNDPDDACRTRWFDDGVKNGFKLVSSALWVSTAALEEAASEWIVAYEEARREHGNDDAQLVGWLKQEVERAADALKYKVPLAVLAVWKASSWRMDYGAALTAERRAALLDVLRKEEHVRATTTNLLALRLGVDMCLAAGQRSLELVVPCWEPNDAALTQGISDDKVLFFESVAERPELAVLLTLPTTENVPAVQAIADEVVEVVLHGRSPANIGNHQFQKQWAEAWLLQAC